MESNINVKEHKWKGMCVERNTNGKESVQKGT